MVATRVNNPRMMNSTASIHSSSGMAKSSS